jgi:hypothetical protein
MSFFETSLIYMVDMDLVPDPPTPKPVPLLLIYSSLDSI